MEKKKDTRAWTIQKLGYGKTRKKGDDPLRTKGSRGRERPKLDITSSVDCPYNTSMKPLGTHQAHATLLQQHVSKHMSGVGNDDHQGQQYLYSDDSYNCKASGTHIPACSTSCFQGSIDEDRDDSKHIRHTIGKFASHYFMGASKPANKTKIMVCPTQLHV